MFLIFDAKHKPKKRNVTPAGANGIYLPVTPQKS
jgi:hypothetical protein